MNNVLMDALPEAYAGKKLNTDFRIGIQIYQIREDEDLNEYEKVDLILSLLFRDEVPDDTDEIEAAVSFFMDGWYHDGSVKGRTEKRLVDFDIDQWRIFSDFMQVYRINLNEIKYMHFWQFMGMLWNMPYKYSSFLQVIEIRRMDVTAKTGREEKKQIQEAQKIYGLSKKENHIFTEEEKKAIDEYDRMMEKLKKKVIQDVTV